MRILVAAIAVSAAGCSFVFLDRVDPTTPSTTCRHRTAAPAADVVLGVLEGVVAARLAVEVANLDCSKANRAPPICGLGYFIFGVPAGVLAVSAIAHAASAHWGYHQRANCRDARAIVVEPAD